MTNRRELREPKKSVRLTAMPIVIGFCIGNGASYAILYVSGLAFLWILVAQGVTPQHAYAQAFQSNSYLLYTHALAFFATAFGGYWTARLSQRDPVWHALFAGVGMLLFGVVQFAVPYELPVPSMSRLITIVSPVPAFLFGALWWKGQQ